MIGEDIVMVCAPDFSGQIRGKAFPLADLEKRRQRGIGWVPTNIQITTFNSIADSPFGPLGDLLMVPDPETEVLVDYADGSPKEHFFLGRILETDGSPWPLCLRGRLSEALDALRGETGLELRSAFELEFQFLDETPDQGPGFSLGGLRQGKAFGEAYLAALRQAGVEPDSFLREWGPRQYEVTVHPQLGIKAADHALAMRALAQATAQRLGTPLTFTPMRSAEGVGNGVHIHMSLEDSEGRPATYDPEGPGGLSKVARHFVAGILHHLPAIIAFMAPSVISYARLTPHRWSAAFNNLGLRDREAAMRICPLAELPGLDPAGQYNVEFRASDSAASPHLQLAALVFAGLDGIREEMEPSKPGQEDISELSAEALAKRGVVHLPQTLNHALKVMAGSKAVRSWFGDPFVDVYLAHKRGEMAFLDGKPIEEVCRLYEQAY